MTPSMGLSERLVGPAYLAQWAGLSPQKRPSFLGISRVQLQLSGEPPIPARARLRQRTAFLAHARFAMSLSRPPESVDRHMPGYLLSATTRPKLRRPASKTQPVPSRRQVRRWDLR